MLRALRGKHRLYGVWEERMAILEAIHVEIVPQLKALRETDLDYILGFETDLQ